MEQNALKGFRHNKKKTRKIVPSGGGNPVKAGALVARQQPACADNKPPGLEGDWHTQRAQLKFEINKEILPPAHEWMSLGVVSQLCLLVIHGIRALKKQFRRCSSRHNNTSATFSPALLFLCYMPR